MGMFDDVKCYYPTPWPDSQTRQWRSKDTPAQCLDQYEIRADGTLWHEEYESRFEKNEEAPLGFYIHCDNRRWVQMSEFTGSLEIYDADYTIIFWFRDGHIRDVVYYNGTGPDKTRQDMTLRDGAPQNRKDLKYEMDETKSEGTQEVVPQPLNGGSGEAPQAAR